MIIRPSKLSDKKQLEYICAATALDEKYKNNQELVSLLYLDYYIDNQTDNCFVIADDNDLAVGYILCDTNYKEYKKLNKPYLKKVRKIDFGEYLGHVAEEVYLNRIYSKYPTHMHIDILEEYQHFGFGKKLVLTLIEHLKSQNIHSLRLTVGLKNTNALNFYKKLGFTCVKKIFNNAAVLIIQF